MIGRWYTEQCACNSTLPNPWEIALRWSNNQRQSELSANNPDNGEGNWGTAMTMELRGVQVDRNKYPSLQHNTTQVKGNQRVLPKPIIVKVDINGRPARALLDSGSLGDFI